MKSDAALLERAFFVVVLKRTVNALLNNSSTVAIRWGRLSLGKGCHSDWTHGVGLHYAVGALYFMRDMTRGQSKRCNSTDDIDRRVAGTNCTEHSHF